MNPETRNVTPPSLKPWSPDSWRGLPAAQQPVYRDPAAVEMVLVELRQLPPLVEAEEVDHLHIPFETALTRYVPEKGCHYNLGAHFLWIGERTCQLDGAHLECIRGLANPIGL